MGKTSLLRQLELLTGNPESALVPLFWDLQGCQTGREMSYELVIAIEDVAARFEPYGVQVAEFVNQDAVVILRSLGRILATHDKQLLLLVDEAEVLIDIARQEPAWLARLRKVFQEGRLRTIVTSTKFLAKLNEANAGWTTSPFLFGFNLANLWTLDREAAIALILQSQAPDPVVADDAVIEDILIHTNGHPYLIQYLCQRLFQTDQDDGGTLRPIREEDLQTDHIVAGFFQIDYQYLTSIERRLLLCIAELTMATESEILAALSDESPDRIKVFLYGLKKLGYLQQIYGKWALGNEFLRRWVKEHYEELRRDSASLINDAVHEKILELENRNELAYVQHQIERIERELALLLEEKVQAGEWPDADLCSRIDRLQADLDELRRRLDDLLPKR